ncbi:hypothetical protein FACS1894166_06580 [Bacilli bacterium]|nr:hypothetical protein FACS1894166_06580 [Bacilli bacterium]
MVALGLIAVLIYFSCFANNTTKIDPYGKSAIATNTDGCDGEHKNLTITTNGTTYTVKNLEYGSLDDQKLSQNNKLL